MKRPSFHRPTLGMLLASAVLALPSAAQPVTMEELTGDWLLASYQQALVASRSPLAAARQAEPIALLIRDREGVRQLIVTNFHEVLEAEMRGLDAANRPGFATLLLAEDPPEAAKAGGRRVPIELRKTAEGFVELVAQLWSDEGPADTYRRLPVPIARWVNELLVAGEYRDASGLPWRFTPQGELVAPTERFSYEIALDLSESDCDYLQTPSPNEPGGQRRIGFAWNGQTLELFKIAYNRPAPISCDREPWMVLKPAGRGLSLPKMGSIIPEMGTISSANSRLADALFSPVQQRVLGILFGQPERSFRGSEIIASAASGTGAAHRQLMRLAESGLLTVTQVGNQKHYQANRESPVFAELSGLVLKTSGLAGPLASALAPLAREISAAFVFGSIAKGADTAASDIDLMVITDGLHYGELYDALQTAEQALGRTISLHLSTLDDWRTKREAGHPFVAKVSGQPRIFVLGSEDALS